MIAKASMSVDAKQSKVVVTGAGGRTGSLVFKKVLAHPQYEPVGVVRSESSKNALVKSTGATDEQIVVGDILGSDGAAVLDKAMAGADSLVIATSAVPKIKPLSLIPVILAKITGKEGVRPKFTFKEDQMPEQVDWIGQKMQIDSAKKNGVKKVVLVGSMGGTQKDNFLNTIGDGNILVWKRRAEKYLIDSGLDYTIIHPGGLKDDEGGLREIVLNVDDIFLDDKSGPRSTCSPLILLDLLTRTTHLILSFSIYIIGIPRADVAELCVQSLGLASRRAFDCVARNVGEGTPTVDFAALFAGMTKNCDYSDMKDDEILGGTFASKS